MKTARIIIAVIFILILTIPLPLSLIFYNSDNSNEKREKAEWPTSLTNDYFTNVDKWFNDRSPFREMLIDLYAEAEFPAERNYFNLLMSIFYGKDESVQEKDESVQEKDESVQGKDNNDKYDFDIDHGIEPTLPEFPVIEDYDNKLKYPYLDKGKSYYPYKSKGAVFYGRDDWLFYLGDSSLDFYTGKNAMDNSEMEKFYTKVSTLDALLAERGVELRYMVLPNKEQVYADKMPTLEIVHNAKVLQRLSYYMKSKGYNNYLYPLEELINGREGGKDTYYKQDTHWNSYGAMIALSCLMPTIDNVKVDYEVTHSMKKGGDLANMLSYDGDEYEIFGANCRNEVVYTQKVLDDYGYHIVYKSNGEAGRNCMIIGDSFRLALIPNLVKFFDTTVSYHYSLALDINRIAQDIDSLKEGDVLVIENVERYYMYGINITDLITQYLLQQK